MKSSYKTILSYLLLGSFRQTRRARAVDIKSLPQRLIHDNRVLGISGELIDDLLSVYERDRLTALRILETIIEKAEIDRYGDYWHLELDDDQLTNIYEAAGYRLRTAGSHAHGEDGERCAPTVRPPVS